MKSARILFILPIVLDINGYKSPLPAVQNLSQAAHAIKSCFVVEHLQVLLVNIYLMVLFFVFCVIKYFLCEKPLQMVQCVSELS